jgi:hypothetical protein
MLVSTPGEEALEDDFADGFRSLALLIQSVRS